VVNHFFSRGSGLVVNQLSLIIIRESGTIWGCVGIIWPSCLWGV